MANHETLTGTALHESFHYVQASDPGAVGASKYWLDTTSEPYVLKRRNAGNADWVTIGSSGDLSAYVAKALFDAQTILAATADDTPAALTIAEATIVGRQTGGNISAIAQVSAGEKTAGTETALRGFSPDDVKDMAVTHGGGGTSLANSSISPTTANVSAAAGNRYFADVSGMTADRNFVLPTCVAGNEIELVVTVEDDTYELIIIGDTGVTINGGSAATEWSRVFISGENVRFVADGADSWRVVHDGRIPCHGKMKLSGDDTTNTAATETTPTWDSAVVNVGNVCDLTNYRFNIRRAGNYTFYGNYQSVGNVSDTQYVIVKIFLNAGQVAQSIYRQSVASAIVNAPATPPETVVCAVGDYLLYQYRPQAANMGIDSDFSFFEVKEA